MKITIISDRPITLEDKQKIREIFLSSESPEERLADSIVGARLCSENIVCIGVKGGYLEIVEV